MLSKLKQKFLDSELLRHSSLLLLASASGSLVLFISSILLARIFGPNDFANFKIATNLFIFLPSLIEFGIGITLTKYIAEFAVSHKERIPHLIVSLLKIRVVSFAFLLTVLFLFRFQIAEWFFHSPQLAPLVLAGLWVSGFIYFEVFRQIALGFQEFKNFAFSQFLMLFFSGVFSLVLGYFFGVFWALIGWGLAYLLGNLPSLFLTIKKMNSVFSHSFDTTTIFMGFSLPMYSLIIPNLLGTALVPLLSLFFSTQQIGLFAFGMIFFNGAVLLPQAFSQVLLPKIAESQEKKLDSKKLLLNNLRSYSLVILPTIILAIFITKPVISLVAPDFLPGLFIVQALTIACLLLGYLTILGTFCAATERVRENWVISLIRNILLLAISFGVLVFGFQ